MAALSLAFERSPPRPEGLTALTLWGQEGIAVTLSVVFRDQPLFNVQRAKEASWGDTEGKDFSLLSQAEYRRPAFCSF